MTLSIYFILRVKTTPAFSVSLVTLYFVRGPENFSFLLGLSARFTHEHPLERAPGETGGGTRKPRVAAEQSRGREELTEQPWQEGSLIVRWIRLESGQALCDGFGGLEDGLKVLTIGVQDLQRRDFFLRLASHAPQKSHVSHLVKTIQHRGQDSERVHRILHLLAAGR